MTGFLIYIIGVVVLAVLVFWMLGGKKVRELEKELNRIQKEMEKEREMFGGLDEFNKKVAQIKKERKEKIMSELQARGKVDAGRVADLVEVSRITAFRYLEELEKENKIKQVGAFGRGVEYKLK